MTESTKRKVSFKQSEFIKGIKAQDERIGFVKFQLKGLYIELKKLQKRRAQHAIFLDNMEAMKKC